MVNKKIKMNEKNADGTFNVLHPETTTEQVINPLTGQSINEHFADTTKKHIEIVDEIPANLVGRGVFFKKTDSTSTIPTVPSYGGKFAWRYNATTNSLDLVVLD